MRHTGQKEHWNKYNADAESGNKGRHGDFLRSFENGRLQGLTGGHMAVNILDGNRRVINQDSHREG